MRLAVPCFVGTRRLVWYENPLFFLACLLLGLAASASSNAHPRPPNQSAIVQIPGLGAVNVSVEGDDDKIPLHLVFTDVSGKTLTDVHFNPWDGSPYEQDDLRFEVMHIKGVETPLIVATAIEPGASDAGFETTALTTVDGKLQDLLATHVQTDTEGAVCVGNLGPQHEPSMLVVDFIWGEGEGHMQPHRYSYSLYLWDGKRFSASRHAETKSKYRYLESALREFGYRCDHDIPYSLFKDEY